MRGRRGANSAMVWLKAGSAGWPGFVVEVGDGHGSDTDGWAVLRDGGGDGGLLGAGGEAVGGVFYVAAGDDGVGGVLGGWLRLRGSGCREK